jgi:hypothetical protein
MPVTRIKNNQITDATIVASAKLVDFSITSSKIANNLTYGSDLTVTGNLTVNGTTTTIDTVDLVIEDPLILLAKNQTGTPSLDIGYIGKRGDEDNIAFVWDESESQFVAVFTTSETTNTTISINSYASMQVLNLTASNANITGNLTFSGNIVGSFGVTGNLTANNISSNNAIDAVTITASGNLVGGNANIGNAVNSTTVNATGNVTGGNVSAGSGIISTTGNVNGGNFTTLGNIVINDPALTVLWANGQIDTAGPVISTGNVTGGNVLSNALVQGATVTATGNLTGGNANITNAVNSTTVNATGNITANNISSNNAIDGVTITASGNLVGNNATIGNAITTGTLETTGNALIGGNLIVNGNITYINIDDLRVEDPIIILGTGPNGTPLTVNDGLDRGIYLEYYISNVGTSNAFVGFDNSTGNMIIANDVEFSANDVVQVNAYGTLEVGNIYGQSANITGNVDAGNINITTALNVPNINVSGNVLAGNLNSNAAVTGVTFLASGNITANNISSNNAINGVTITASGNLVGNNAVIGNTAVANTIEAVVDVITPNVTSSSGLSITTGSDGNITLDPNGTGLIILTDETANAIVYLDANKGISTSANWTFDGTNANLQSGNLTVANVIISGEDITSAGSELTINGAGADVNFRVEGDTDANLFVTDAGTDTVLIGTATPTTDAKLVISSTDSILIPTGNSLQRPATGVTGMLRFNTTTNVLEFYDADSWESAGTTFTIVVSDQFTGDGSTVAFTLSQDSTTAATIVAINGVVQIPTTAYSVTGNVMTFTEAPLSSDVIDARILTTTTIVTALQNSTGNAVIEASETSQAFNITGSLIPTANVTFDLGSNSSRWRDGYFAGNSITLGNIVMKNTGGNSIGFFGPDGSTPATLDANVQVVGDAIESGTSNVSFASGNGNVSLVVGGNITGVITATGANITGTLGVTGNATVGNLSATNIVGTLTTASQTNITSVGTLGSLSVTANVAGGNLTTGGQVSATGNITGGNINTAGQVVATGNITGGNLSATNIVGTLTTAAQTNITSVGTLTSLSVTGNTSAGNLLINNNAVITGNLTVNGTETIFNVQTLSVNDKDIVVANNVTGGANVNGAGIQAGNPAVATWFFNNATTSWQSNIGITPTANGTLSLGGASNYWGSAFVTTISATGNANVGNIGAAAGVFTGTVTLGNIVNAGANGVGNIGSSGGFFNTVFAKATSAQYADLAEMYESDAAYAPGTVIAFGGSKEVTQCALENDTRVAGVVSTNPSYIMNANQSGEHVVAVALTGRVPCRVTGQVRKGDLMVSAGNGMARAENNPRVGSIIGKALADFDGAEGVIEVVVGRF